MDRMRTVLAYASIPKSIPCKGNEGYGNWLHAKLSMMDVKQLNILGLILTALGLLQVIGFILAVQGVPAGEAVLRFSQGTGISALPTPFRDSNGYENFASERAYTIRLHDGQVRMITDKEVGQILPGPHRRIVPYFNSLVMLPRLPKPLTASVLQYLFCESDFPIRKGITLTGNPIASVDIHVTVQTVAREQFEDDTQIACK